ALGREALARRALVGGSPDTRTDTRQRAGLSRGAPGPGLLRIGAGRASRRRGGAHPRLPARLLPGSVVALVPPLPSSAPGHAAAALAHRAGLGGHGPARRGWMERGGGGLGAAPAFPGRPGSLRLARRASWQAGTARSGHGAPPGGVAPCSR